MRLRSLGALVLIGAGCASPPAARGRDTNTEPTSAPATTETVADAPCASVTAGERFELAEGGQFISASGLVVHYLGQVHDDFDDGRYDVSASIAYHAEGEPSATGLSSLLGTPRFEPIGAYCVRVGARGGRDGVTVEVAPRASAIHALARCAPPTTPRLDDLMQAADGARMHLEVTRNAETGAWEPSPMPRVILHHASHITFAGLSAHPELAAAATSGRLRFEIELVSHTVEQDAHERGWSSDYRARVLAVCAP